MAPETGGNPENTACRLCGAACGAVFTLTLRLRYQVSFFLCPSCGLLQTSSPFWLGEAYETAISALDTGILKRNLALAKISTTLLRLLGNRNDLCLDYGGGHGILTRLMRDRGFDFRWQDRYAENLFARGFEYDGTAPVGCVTAFEVLEHLVDPGQFFADILGRLQPALFLASTELFQEPADPSWNYLYPVAGQHISFYQERTLERVARQYGYHRARWRYFHLFSKKPVSRLLIRCLAPLGLVLHPLMGRPSLVLKDQAEVLGKIISKGP